jgi:hypothetical protein
MRYQLVDETTEATPPRFVLVDDTPPAAVQAGQALNAIPRQLGLAARYGIEGPAQAAQIVTEPIAGLMRLGGIPTKSLAQIAADVADRLGLPKPEGANERTVGEATKLMAGAGGTVGAARGAANLLTGMAGNVASGLAAGPVTQLLSGAGAGGAAQASKEAGGSGWAQVGSGLVGGVLAGMVPGAGMALGNAVANRAQAGRNALTPQQVDVQIQTILANATGDDAAWQAIPEKVRQTLRAQVSDALNTGKELDPKAIARLADFALVGATPTRGAISQNPVQLTREKNLAKMGANTMDDQLGALANIENQNNTVFIGRLNDLGAGRVDAMQVGQRLAGDITAKDETLQKATTALYNQARGMPGGDVPLNRANMVNSVYGALTKENKLAFLPKEVSDMIDTISLGQVKRGDQVFQVPFDANTLDNLLTTIATAQRGTRDGNVKAALSIARQAIDGADLRLPDTPGTAQAAQFFGALNTARDSHRQRMQWQESSGPVASVIDGAQPDKLFERFAVSGSLADAKALAAETSPAVVRDGLMGWLKEKSIGAGAADDMAKFSSAAFRKALNQIGDRKLSLFFAPEEIAQLKALGRVSTAAQFQPAGSAVNNSNSGALVGGLAVDALRGFPGAGLISGGIRQATNNMTARLAQDVRPALTVRKPFNPEEINYLQGLLGPAIAAGGTAAGGGGLLAP